MKFSYPDDSDWRDEWVAYFQAREDHLNSLRDRLPTHVIAIGEEYGTEDALIAKVFWSRGGKDLSLVLRCGNIPAGYFDWVLTYKDAEITPDAERLLARLARSAMIGKGNHDADLARHELDVTEEGGIEHRLEFHVFMRGSAEFAIRCRDIRVRKISKPGRRLPRLRERFSGGPPTECGRFPNPWNGG